jgi:CelD/BcsL family acetyltransferase involved in cellulose biosynthesis
MSSLLGRISHELSDLAVSLVEMQSLVSPLLSEAASQDPAYLREVQAFDHIRQKLSGLADFLAALVPTTPRHWALDPSAASEIVTLSELSARLRFHKDDRAAQASVASGDCELF